MFWTDETGRTIQVQASRSEVEEELGIAGLYTVSEERESMAQYLTKLEAEIQALADRQEQLFQEE